MQTIQYQMPEGVDREANSMLVMAKNYAIENQPMMACAAEDLRGIKTKFKELEAQRTGLVNPLNKVVKDINALFKPALESLETAERVLKGAMSNYIALEERKAMEARRKAEDEARAIRQQAEAEARAIAEQAAKASGAERAALEAEAQAKQEEALVVAAAPVAAPVKTEGVSYRDDWDFEIVDVAKIPREYLIPDEKKIRAYVKAMKESSGIDGVRVFSKKVVASR